MKSNIGFEKVFQMTILRFQIENRAIKRLENALLGLWRIIIICMFPIFEVDANKH